MCLCDTPVRHAFTPSINNKKFTTHVDYPAQHTNGVGAVQVVVPIDIFDQTGHHNDDLHFFGSERFCLVTLQVQRTNKNAQQQYRSRRG